jgi:hypothetical protein
MKANCPRAETLDYRRIHIMLKREGTLVNHMKLFRLYRDEKLSVRRRGGRKRAIGTRAPMVVPMVPNQRWSLDFVFDQFTDGRRFRRPDDAALRERLRELASERRQLAIHLPKMCSFRHSSRGGHWSFRQNHSAWASRHPNGVEFTGNANARQRVVNDGRQTFFREVIDDT